MMLGLACLCAARTQPECLLVLEPSPAQLNMIKTTAGMEKPQQDSSQDNILLKIGPTEVLRRTYIFLPSRDGDALDACFCCSFELVIAP